MTLESNYNQIMEQGLQSEPLIVVRPFCGALGVTHSPVLISHPCSEGDSINSLFLQVDFGGITPWFIVGSL